jgi:hypothetical protein
VAHSDLAHTAATWALDIADEALADPAHAHLHTEGGWMANRRRALEGFVGDSGPLTPPGAGRLIEHSPVSLADLGHHPAWLPTTNHYIPRLRTREKAVQRGTQILLGLLDWALAAATHQPPDHTPWQTSAPTGRRDPHTRWTARMEVPEGTLPLQLRVEQHNDAGGFRYEVRPGPDGVPTVVYEAMPLRFSSAPSLPAALALAEHAGAEVAAGALQLRTRDRRLLIPRSAPQTGAAPHLADLITAAAPRGNVLGLYDVLANLGTHTRYRSAHTRYPSPEQAGHRNTQEEAVTLSAMLTDEELPATRFGEAANTTPVNSPAYRRHLAAHESAIDPFAEAYLAAADALPGQVEIGTRHLAGRTALQSCDLRLLQRSDPRPAPYVEDFAELIGLIPADLSQMEAFAERWFRQCEQGAQGQPHRGV